MADGIRFPDDMITTPTTLVDADKLLISDSVDAKKAKWWDLGSVRNWLSNTFSKLDASNLTTANVTSWQSALNVAFLTDKINSLVEGDAYVISINGFYTTDDTTANLPSINKVGVLRVILSGVEKYLTYLTFEGGKLTMWGNKYNGSTWEGWNALSSGAAIDTATDTTNFTTLLSVTDTDVQKALDTLDKHVHSVLYQPDKTNPFVYTDNGGALHIDGDIIQNGVAYETHVEQVFSKNDLIITRDGAVAGLGVGEYTGIQASLYDGVNSGQLVFDKDGWARVGDVGNLVKIATIQETPTDGELVAWNSSSFALVSIPFGITAGTVSEGNHTHSQLHTQNTDYMIEKLGTLSTITNTASGAYGRQFTPLDFVATTNDSLSKIKVFVDTLNQTTSLTDIVIDIFDHEFLDGEILSTGLSGYYLEGYVHREEGFTLTAGNTFEEWTLSTPYQVTSGQKYSIIIYSAADPLYGKVNIYFKSSTDAAGMIVRAIGSDGSNIVASATDQNVNFEITLQPVAKVICGTNGNTDVIGGLSVQGTQVSLITHNHDSIYAKINNINTFIRSAFNGTGTTTKGIIIQTDASKRWLVGSYDSDGTGDTGSQLRFIRYDNTGGAAGYVMLLERSNSSVLIGSSGVPSERLEVNGNVKCVALIETSDRTLKKDINVLNKGVDGLRPVSYRFKQTGDFHYGFIAQDILETHPELVKGSKDDTYSIKSGSITALIVVDVQKNKQDIKQLKTEIKQLKKELELVRQKLTF